MKVTKEQKAITLIALIITIVVLLILAAVAISSITNDGILSYAQNAATDYNQAVKNEQDMLDGYLEFLEGSVKIVDKDGNDLRNKKVTSNTEVYDRYGNKIVIPAGFKIRVDDTTNNADTVTEGIVIEDENGNQFVWIPVGKIYTDTEKTEANAKTITLGRYVFADGVNDLDGDGTILPAGEITSLSKTNPSDELKIESSNSYNFTEGLKDSTTTNAHARDIEAFVESANTKGGYYLGRYEAGDSSSNILESRTGVEGSGISTEGTLVCKANQVPYNWITQPDASSKSQNMYADGYSSGTFSSDLVNSYAWDTAIIFIQTFGMKSNSSSYSMTVGMSAINTSIAQKTGGNKLNLTNAADEQLNIYDMAGNCKEWTTETSSYAENYPVVDRGGVFGSNGTTVSGRRSGSIYWADNSITFRLILYVAL